MNEAQQGNVQLAHQIWWAARATDNLVWVAGDGTETGFAAVLWDEESESGLEIDSGGVQEEEIKQVVLYRPVLDQLGVSIQGDGHFLYRGERWDLAAGKPLLADIGPISGHLLVRVWIRRAAELESSDDSDQIVWVDD